MGLVIDKDGVTVFVSKGGMVSSRDMQNAIKTRKTIIYNYAKTKGKEMKENFGCGSNNHGLLASEYTKFTSGSQNLDTCEFVSGSSFCTSMIYSRNVHFSRFSGFCDNLIFCYAPPHHSQNMAFGKNVTIKRFKDIKAIVMDIFGHLRVESNLLKLYASLPASYWSQLASIPEFDNNEVKCITDIDVETFLKKKDQVCIKCEGKEVWISRDSALALKLIEE